MVLFKTIYRHTVAVGPQALICFVIGVVFGFFLAILFTISSNLPLFIPSNSRMIDSEDPHYLFYPANVTSPYFALASSTHVSESDHSVADALFKDIRVLCFLMTYPSNNLVKAQHVLRTWGKRCNKIIFISAINNTLLGAVTLPVTNDRRYVWARTKAAFKYVHDNHLNDFDWFLKADDDTYVVMENLRYMLYPHSPDELKYFGNLVQSHATKDYISTGVGYVLSRKALQQFVDEALPRPNLCSGADEGYEDDEMKRCMENVGIKIGETRDSDGRNMFLQLTRKNPPHTQPVYWYWMNVFNGIAQGFDSCSDYAVSFHYVTPMQMYVLEFVIYHLRPYGIRFNETPLPSRRNDTAEPV